MTGTTDSARRFGWLAGVAAALSILACYGTLFLISTLSSLGVALVVHEGAWAGVISLFALLAVLGVLLGYQRHRVPFPPILAAAGAGLILWVMFGRHDRIVEIAGFAALVAAAVWDWSLKARKEETTHG